MTWLVGWESRLLAGLGLGFVLYLILVFDEPCLATRDFGPGN